MFSIYLKMFTIWCGTKAIWEHRWMYRITVRIFVVHMQVRMICFTSFAMPTHQYLFYSHQAKVEAKQKKNVNRQTHI